MKKLMIPLLFLAAAMPLLAQTATDEHDAIAAALDRQFNRSMPYVQHWVINSTSEALLPCNYPKSECTDFIADYVERNEVPADMTTVSVGDRAEFGDLSQFVKDGVFDWTAFEAKYGPGTWTVRIARPGFSDATHAVVRMDVWAKEKRVPALTASLFVAKVDGTWKAVGGVSPAVAPEP